MLAVALIVLGAGLVLLGFVGCVLPVLPGPPLALAGIVALWGARGWHADGFGPWTIVVLGASALLVTVLDMLAPAWGAKRYGASKAGVWGSVVGMLGGAVFFPPFGMLVGAFVGALVFEMLWGAEEANPWKGAYGVFVGTVLGILLKLVVTGVIAFYFVRELL